MRLIATKIPGVNLLEPDVHGDERGFFLETWRQTWLDGVTFVQENHSKSVFGTLRGLHYQLPNPQGKLVRVVQGEVLDVVVDLRQSSATFGAYVMQALSADNKLSMWVPEGFAHGFLVMSKTAEVIYKCTDYYSPADEHSLRWDDPAIAIDWPQGIVPLLSDKDAHAPFLENARLYE